jgi:ribosome-binding protein aMBF1 (putative translation factor)
MKSPKPKRPRKRKRVRVRKKKPVPRSTERLARAFGRNLLELRRARGLSQRALGRRARLTAPTVCNLEGGTFAPSLDSLKKLKRGLAVSWDRLLKGL